jgi:superfamily II DNA/RNA helicase
MDQRARMASLDAFRNGAVDLIVCSDVAARGLDIPDVSHVFNFDVPTHAEDYVHRIGRTGRAGKAGAALSIVTSEDRKYIAEIEKLIGRSIDWQGPNVSDLRDDGSAQEPETRSRRSERVGERPRRGSGRPVRSEQRPHAANGHAPEAAPVARSERARPRRPELAAERPRAPERATHERRPNHHAEDDQPVVGLGDHVPSFLLRPVKLRPLKVAAEE